MLTKDYFQQHSEIHLDSFNVINAIRADKSMIYLLTTNARIGHVWFSSRPLVCRCLYLQKYKHLLGHLF